MTRFGPRIEPITFPTPGGYATSYATDAKITQMYIIRLIRTFFGFISHLFKHKLYSLLSNKKDSILRFFNSFKYSLM